MGKSDQNQSCDCQKYKIVLSTILIILTTSIITIGGTYIYTNYTTNNTRENFKNTPQNENIEKIDWTLISGDPMDSCSKPTWNGSATVRGWYDMIPAYPEGEQWGLKIIGSDLWKLPITPFFGSDVGYTLNEASTEIISELKNASESNPLSFVINGYSIYCEGAPIISIIKF